MRKAMNTAGEWDSLSHLAADLQGPAEISANGRLVVEAMTTLPTEAGVFQVRLFRWTVDPSEHLAISVGQLDGATHLPVRVHSECFTGEVLRSRKCDCAAQLEFALELIQKRRRGLVIYLRQEGRGIGLANKLRAYELQRAGADTVDANRLLGLPDDARRYDAAAALLAHLRVHSVELITNNPAKTRELEALGVAVSGRTPVLVAGHPEARNYLRTKAERMDHLLSLQPPLR